MNRKATIGSFFELDKNQVKNMIAQQKPHVDFSERITPYNGDPGWKERLNKMSWWSVGYTGKVEPGCEPLLGLRDKLLSIGGCEVCLPDVEEDLDDILQYGQVWDNITTQYKKGRPCQCHANSADLWYNNRETCKNGHAVVLCTGYALSEDGVWRQHSWLIHVKPRANVIIETTEPRVAYFGFGMSYEQAMNFAYENV